MTNVNEWYRILGTDLQFERDEDTDEICAAINTRAMLCSNSPDTISLSLSLAVSSSAIAPIGRNIAHRLGLHYVSRTSRFRHRRPVEVTSGRYVPILINVRYELQCVTQLRSLITKGGSEDSQLYRSFSGGRLWPGKSAQLQGMGLS